MEAGNIPSSKSRWTSQPTGITRSRSLISLSDSWTRSSALHGFGKSYSSKGKKMRGLGSSNKVTVKTQRGFGWNFSFSKGPSETSVNEFLYENLVSIRLKYSQLRIKGPNTVVDPFPDIDEISALGPQEDFRAHKQIPPRRSFSADSERKNSVEERPNFAITPYWAGFVRGVYPNSLSVDDLAKRNSNVERQGPTTVSSNPTNPEESSDVSKDIRSGDPGSVTVESSKVPEIFSEIQDKDCAIVPEMVPDNGSSVIPANQDIVARSESATENHFEKENGLVNVSVSGIKDEVRDSICTGDTSCAMIKNGGVSSEGQNIINPAIDPTFINNDIDSVIDTLTKQTEGEHIYEVALLTPSHKDLSPAIVPDTHNDDYNKLDFKDDDPGDTLFADYELDDSEELEESEDSEKLEETKTTHLNYEERTKIEVESTSDTSDILEGISDSDLSEMLYGGSVEMNKQTANRDQSSILEETDPVSCESGIEEVLKDLDSIGQYENIMIPNYGEDLVSCETSPSGQCMDENIGTENTNVKGQLTTEIESDLHRKIRSNSLIGVDDRTDHDLESSSMHNFSVSESGNAISALELSMFRDNNKHYCSVEDLTHL